MMGGGDEFLMLQKGKTRKTFTVYIKRKVIRF